MKTIQIPINSPFSFQQNIEYLKLASEVCLYEIGDQWIRKAIPTAHAIPIVEITGTSSFVDILFVENKEYSVEVEREVIQYVSEWLDLDNDLQPFYKLAKQDALLSIPIDRFYGLRNVGIPNLFEALCWAVLGQQITLSFAYTLKKRFVETFGTAVTWQGKDYWCFPETDVIAHCTIEQLTALQMTRRKAEYIIGIANEIVEQRLSKEQLLTESFDSAQKILTSIRGVGPWTANYVCMRCLRFPNAFPVGDVGLQNAVKYLLRLEEKPSPSQLHQLGARWKNWQSYATFYLWRTLY